MGGRTDKTILESFHEAWNAHDLDALMEHMTEDCVYRAARPAAPGEQFRGKHEVAGAYQTIFDAFPDAAWSEGRHYVIGERGFSEWVFSGTGVDGTAVIVPGCDLFHLHGGLIAVKDSFRKLS